MGESLLKALGRRLPPVHPRLSVVTSNYDMLIEYSCAKSGLRYTSGHVGEMIRTWNWRQAQGRSDQVCRCRPEGQGRPRAPLPRVELYKVHGSINLFRGYQDRSALECDVWAEEAPDGFDRVVATPGDQKFESYASNIEVAAPAREAEANAMAFMVVGYGFNDAHLHNVFMNGFDRMAAHFSS